MFQPPLCALLSDSWCFGLAHLHHARLGAVHAHACAKAESREAQVGAGWQAGTQGARRQRAAAACRLPGKSALPGADGSFQGHTPARAIQRSSGPLGRRKRRSPASRVRACVTTCCRDTRMLLPLRGARRCPVKKLLAARVAAIVLAAAVRPLRPQPGSSSPAVSPMRQMYEAGRAELAGEACHSPPARQGEACMHVHGLLLWLQQCLKPPPIGGQCSFPAAQAHPATAAPLPLPVLRHHAYGLLSISWPPLNVGGTVIDQLAPSMYPDHSVALLCPALRVLRVGHRRRSGNCVLAESYGCTGCNRCGRLIQDSIETVQQRKS